MEDKFAPHHEAELQGCCSVLSSFLGKVLLLAFAAAAAVVAAAVAVEYVAHAASVAELAWLDAGWSTGEAFEMSEVH